MVNFSFLQFFVHSFFRLATLGARAVEGARAAEGARTAEDIRATKSAGDAEGAGTQGWRNDSRGGGD